MFMPLVIDEQFLASPYTQGIFQTEKCQLTQRTFGELIKANTEATPSLPFILALTRNDRGRLQAYNAGRLFEAFNRQPFIDPNTKFPCVKIDFLMTWHRRERFELIETCTDSRAPLTRKYLKAVQSEKAQEVLELIRGVAQKKLREKDFIHAEKWLILLAHEYPRESFAFQELARLMHSYSTGTEDILQDLAKAEALHKQLRTLKKAALIQCISRCILPVLNNAVPFAAGFLASYALGNFIDNHIFTLVNMQTSGVSQSCLLTVNAILNICLPTSVALVPRPPVVPGSKIKKHLFVAGWNVNLWSDFFNRSACSLIPQKTLYRCISSGEETAILSRMHAIFGTIFQICAESLARIRLRWNPHLNGED
jgi:hypothetical protein